MKAKHIVIFNDIVYQGHHREIQIEDPKIVDFFEICKEQDQKVILLFPKKKYLTNKNKKFIYENLSLTNEDVFELGVLCKINKVTKKKSAPSIINLKAINRVKVSFDKTAIGLNSDKFILHTVDELPYSKYEYKCAKTFEPVYQKDIDKIDKLLSELKNKNIEILTFDDTSNETSSLFSGEEEGIVDFINILAGCLVLPYEKKYELFFLLSVDEQIQFIINFLESEQQTIDVNDEIEKKVKKNLEKQQRDFILREKLKAIKDTLDDGDNGEEIDDEYSKNINDEKLKQIYPESIQKIIKNEADRLKGMMTGSPDFALSQNYISTLKKLPWRKVEKESLDIKYARKILDKYHYGLEKVKERIIEYIALIINQQKHNKIDQNSLISIDDENMIDLNLFKETQETKSKNQETFNNVPILTLVGPPGTGKTSLAKAIAQALNKKFIKISLGGVHDESEIRGHRRTYVGSMPGKIIKGIQKANVSNPLILLDEIDKMASDHKGDPASAMLEVLDPEQNAKFQDHYLDTEYDLSKVIFIATANYYEDIPAPLLDRVEIIELSSYTINEKVKIARNHLIQKTIEQASLTPEQFKIEDDIIEFIIKNYTSEAGVRGLKRSLDKIARKIVVKVIDSKDEIKEFKIDKKVVQDFLGVPIFSENENEKEAQIGLVNGLAFTSLGGTTLQLEVTTYPGKGDSIKLTGQLKDVMQESAQIALSYVKANAKKFECDKFDFENNQIHIHVPEGAIPKDGPSAGITFTTAIISALSKKPVPTNIGMTGEITLRGKVLEIGGLKEKSFAAYKKGIDTVFIPKNNKKNLIEFPKEVTDFIKFIPVSEYEQVYEYIFKNPEKSKVKKSQK
ncbi:endopeptidase La [Mycoplasmopsis hyopharyngis]|uniref:endopeptidase La n=1 Tax=Mycoplasmopsis hyopharyngis TaxID=29558 RepID=UPI003873A84F